MTITIIDNPNSTESVMVHIISIAEQIRELQDTSTKPPRSVHYGAHYDNGRTGLSSQHSGQTDEAGGRAPQDTTPTIEDPVLRIRQRMQQSTIGVLSGTQANVKSDINFCFYAKNVFYLKFDGFF